MLSTRGTVFIVDDDKKQLSELERQFSQNRIDVACYSSGKEFISAYDGSGGCVLLELTVSDIGGLEIQDKLLKNHFTIPVVFLTGDGGIAESVQAMKAGAFNYLQKPVPPETLIQVVQDALQLDADIRRKNCILSQKRSLFDTLTERENDVLNQLLKNDLAPSSKEIGTILGISYRTVEHHRSKILAKTQTSSVAELRQLAYKLCLSHTDSK